MTNTLRVERAIKHMTQQQLAEAIGVVKYVPATLLSLKISEIFGKTVNEIFMLEESDR